MFEDSESESEADEAPAPKEEPKKPVAKKRRRQTPAPERRQRQRRGPETPGGPRPKRRGLAGGFRPIFFVPLARSGAGISGSSKAGSFVDRMAASFQAPRLVGPSRRGCGATHSEAKPAPSHWTRESANETPRSARLLRANPSSGRDGRAVLTSGRRCTAGRWSFRSGPRRCRRRAA